DPLSRRRTQCRCRDERQVLPAVGERAPRERPARRGRTPQREQGCGRARGGGPPRPAFSRAGAGPRVGPRGGPRRRRGACGGDWARDRLVPDLMRAALEGGTAVVRNPGHVRPWQHVLAPLSAYLELAERLCGDRTLAAPWNLGPREEDERTVRWVADAVLDR